MMSSMIDPYKLDYQGHCFNLEKTKIIPPGATMKMHVPKLMSDIPFSNKAAKTSIIFNGHNSVYINDPPCRPSCGKMLTSLNYISVPLEYNNASWDHVQKDNLNRIPSNTKFYCNFTDGQMKKYSFTTNNC